MASEVSHQWNAIGITSLHGFTIRGAAEFGECSGAQSFRAVRRSNDEPVLLHKFRPAESLVAMGPRIESEGTVDFTRPFVTRFTEIFVAAGSAYLVEPVPCCFNLNDLWRYTLQRRPGQALPVVTVLVRHLLSVTHQFISQGKRHGALCPENIVLASTGNFGVLAAHLACIEGLLWLRRPAEGPAESDFHSLAALLNVLLEIETEVAALQKTSMLLPPAVRHRIADLQSTIRHTRVYRRQVR